MTPTDFHDEPDGTVELPDLLPHTLDVPVHGIVAALRIVKSGVGAALPVGEPVPSRRSHRILIRTGNG